MKDVLVSYEIEVCRMMMGNQEIAPLSREHRVIPVWRSFTFGGPMNGTSFKSTSGVFTPPLFVRKMQDDD